MVRFIMVGDTGSGTEDQHKVAKAMLATIQRNKDMKAVCIVGDNIYEDGVTSVTDPQFQSKFEEPYADIDLPFYLCLGNHDYGNAHFSDGRYKHQIAFSKVSPKWNMPSRYYKQSLGPCDLFFLDTNLVYMDDSEISHQMKTMRNLYRNSKNPWKILCGHHTWRSTGGHGNAEDAFETFLQELCQACRFDMYVCGHDHCQNHSVVTLPNGHQMHNVVIGTGGKRYEDGPVLKENIHKAGDTKLHHASTRLGYTVVHANPQKLTISFHEEDTKGTHTATLTKNLRKSKMKEKGKTQTRRKSKRPITRTHLRSPKRKRFKTRVRSIPKKKPYMRTRRVRRRGMKGGAEAQPFTKTPTPTPPKFTEGQIAEISIGILTCMISDDPHVQTHIATLKRELMGKASITDTSKLLQRLLVYLPGLLLGFSAHLGAAHLARFASPDDLSIMGTFKQGGGYIGEIHRFFAGLGTSLGERLAKQIKSGDTSSPEVVKVVDNLPESVNINTISELHSILAGSLVKIGVPYSEYTQLIDSMGIPLLTNERVTNLEVKLANVLPEFAPYNEFTELSARVDELLQLSDRVDALESK